MSRWRCSLCWILLGLIGWMTQPCAAQNNLAALELAWQEDRFEDIEKLLPAAEKEEPKNPSVAFFRALVQSDAEAAVNSYKQVFESDEMSRYADTALFKMAQYYYARERYAVARKYYRMLQKRFPQTKWLDDSAYLTGQCYLAEGKPDSARMEWKSFVKRYPRSPYCDMAVADLEAQPESAAGTSQPDPSTSAAKTPWYTIQVGAFANPDNARTILAGLEKVGYEGMISQKTVGSRTFHLVWIGRFTDRAAAEDYARRFITKVTREYSIIKNE